MAALHHLQSQESPTSPVHNHKPVPILDHFTTTKSNHLVPMPSQPMLSVQKQTKEKEQTTEDTGRQRKRRKRKKARNR
jgi:hypothetical protein